MPSKSPSQHHLMEVAAHTKGGYGGVPQSVGKEFTAADKRPKAVGVKMTIPKKPFKKDLPKPGKGLHYV